MPSLSVSSVRLIGLYGRPKNEPGQVTLVLDIHMEPVEDAPVAVYQGSSNLSSSRISPPMKSYNYCQHRTVRVEDPGTYIEMWNGGPADKELVKLWLKEELMQQNDAEEPIEVLPLIKVMEP